MRREFKIHIFVKNTFFVPVFFLLYPFSKCYFVVLYMSSWCLADFFPFPRFLRMYILYVDIYHVLYPFVFVYTYIVEGCCGKSRRISNVSVWNRMEKKHVHSFFFWFDYITKMRRYYI